MTQRVVVVGGGITGLTLAWTMFLQAPDVDVTVLEAADRLGGKVWSSEVMGLPVDAGPDAFVVRQPFMEDLCRELELHNALVPPNPGGAQVWLNGAMRPMPKRQYLGIPLDLDELAATGLISADGIARARQDLDAPEDAPVGDESVGSLVRRRLGDEVFENFAGALLGGINAGNADQLSLQAGVPQVAAAARHHPSLIRSVQTHLKQLSRDPAAPVFLSHPNSLKQVITALSDRLLGKTFTSVAATGIERTPEGQWQVTTSDGVVTADVVVLATPTFASAAIVKGAAPEAAAMLERVTYADVIQTVFAFPSKEMPTLETNGFLVPRSEGTIMTAATYYSAKWSHLSVGSSRYIRVHAGRSDDRRAMGMTDADLVAQLRKELSWTAGIDTEPTETRITRWPQSFPQYRPGHLERVAATEAALAAEAPGVLLTGAAYRGLGLPACVRQAREAAHEVLKLLEVGRSE